MFSSIDVYLLSIIGVLVCSCGALAARSALYTSPSPLLIPASGRANLFAKGPVWSPKMQRLKHRLREHVRSHAL
ncbi:hypothetical protein, partial [Pseudomonas syringae]|uniref:hypothetical protein n=1 Tax=Pseudomonas syringae TaxID=317 RepID=UPI001F32CADD